MYCYHHSILSLENALRRTIRLLYLTAARPGRGNGAYVEDILHIENLVFFFFFLSWVAFIQKHVKPCFLPVSVIWS